MTPISYSVKDGVTTFKYNLREFIEWYKLGKKEGNVGMILHSRKGAMDRYMCFGTIENPNTDYNWASIVPFEAFDGPRKTDDEILIPPKPFFTPESTRFIYLDMNNVIKNPLKCGPLTQKHPDANS